MKVLKVLVCVAMLLGAVACSRDPEVVKRKYVENGNRYYERGKYKEAAIMYRNAINKDRRYSEAYYRLALTELKLRQVSNAYRNFHRAADTDPKNLDARVQAANIALVAFVQSKRKNPAFSGDIGTLANEILKLSPDNPSGLRLRGYHLLLAQNKPEEALADFRRANQLKPNDPNIVLPLAQCLLQLNQVPEAEKALRQTVAAAKTDQRSYDLLYGLLMQTNRPEEAEKTLLAKVANLPAMMEPQLQLAAHYQYMRRPADAKAVVDKAVANPSFVDARLRAGRFYARFRDFDAALSHLEAGVKSGTERKRMYQKAIAEIYIVQRRMTEAQQLLDELVKSDPKDDESRAIRAAIQLESGDPRQIQTALVDLEAGVKQNPKNAVLRFNYARALLQKRQFDQARRQLQESIAAAPNYISPRLALAELQYLKGEYGLSRQTARAVLDIDPDNLPAKMIETTSLASAGEREQARALLKEMTVAYPGAREPFLQLGMLSLGDQKYAEAEGIFSSLQQKYPADLRGLMGLAETYAAQKQYDKAMALLQAELKKGHKLQLLVAVGNIAFRANRQDEAIAAFLEAVKANPNAAELYTKLGECYRAKNDFKAAAANFNKARELRPNDPLAHMQLALLYEQAGQRDQARPLYEHVLKLQPDNIYALNNLAYALAESGGDLDQALSMAQRAKQRMPDHPDVSDTLGWIYIKKNLSDSAIQVFRELVAKYPERSTFRYHLALALFQQGDKASSKRELQTALSKRPDKAEEAKIRELMGRIG